MQKLHTLLESYKPVRRFKSARITRVFRDDEELPCCRYPQRHHRKSTSFIKVPGGRMLPDTPESEWVDREVRTFIELGRSNRIFALLISGTPDHSFPHR